MLDKVAQGRVGRLSNAVKRVKDSVGYNRAMSTALEPREHRRIDRWKDTLIKTLLAYLFYDGENPGFCVVVTVSTNTLCDRLAFRVIDKKATKL